MLKSNRVTLCWPNYLNEAAVSGGVWSPGLPLSHIQSPLFARYARSANALPGSAQFKVELPRFRGVSAVALASHNLSASAQWRVRVWFDASATELAWDSGQVDVWPAVFDTLETEWENDNWWSGTVTDYDRDAFTPLAAMFLPDVQIVRSVTVELFDALNPDGYITIGRAVVADAWQPEVNQDWGAQHGYHIDTDFAVAGNQHQTEFADPKTPRRTVSFTLSHLTEGEAFRKALALQRSQGIHGEVLYSGNIAPGPVSFAKTFVGRLVQADPLSNPYFSNYSASFNLREIL